MKPNKLGIVLGLGLSVTLVTGITNTAFAQSNSDGYQSNEQDPMYGGSFGGLNPTDLIHRAKLQNGRSAEEFTQDSQSQINNSASDFKRRQQEAILQKYQSESVETEETVAE